MTGEAVGVCASCGEPLQVDASWQRKRPGTKKWMVEEIVTCPSQQHAWRRWRDDPDAAWTLEPDWALLRRCRFTSQSTLRADLLTAVAEIGGRPIRKRDSFDEITRWVIEELPGRSADHPTTGDAIAMATYWRKYGR